MQLTFAWWNTGLSPNRKPDRADADHFRVAAAVLRMLLDGSNADFVALGEISENDLIAIFDLLPEHVDRYAYRSTATDVGRSHFDTAIIFRRGLEVSEPQSVLRHMRGRVFRIAQRFAITGGSDELALCAYVSHWASPLTPDLSEADRLQLGNVLREALDAEEFHTTSLPVVLMGDYNCEPFDGPMNSALMSSRDRAYVARTPYLLYNPFWRHMTSYRHENEDHRFSDRGTFFLERGPLTQWKTVDQILVSSSLLSGSGGWSLDELATRVLEFPELTALVTESTNHFDHLPVVGRIRKNQSHD